MSNPAVSNNPVTIQPKTLNPPTNEVYVQEGNCDKCHTGYMSKQFTCCGICCGICFFPIGLICCFAMREYKCQSCGYSNWNEDVDGENKKVCEL